MKMPHFLQFRPAVSFSFPFLLNCCFIHVLVVDVVVFVLVSSVSLNAGPFKLFSESCCSHRLQASFLLLSMISLFL